MDSPFLPLLQLLLFYSFFFSFLLSLLFCYSLTLLPNVERAGDTERERERKKYISIYICIERERIEGDAREE